MARERPICSTPLRTGPDEGGFLARDNRLIARTSTSWGLAYIDGGYPAPTSPTPIVCAASSFRMRPSPPSQTNRVGRSTPTTPFPFHAAAKAVCVLVAKRGIHVRVALGISNEEELASIANRRRVVKRARSQGGAGKETILDCEHFRRYKEPRLCAERCNQAHKAGARWSCCGHQRRHPSA